MSIPTLQFDGALDTLPLPAVPLQLQREADGLLIYSARLEIRSAIQEIVDGVKECIAKKENIIINKPNWKRIQTALLQISKDGSPDDLFECTMDFLYLASSWLGTHWDVIEENKDLRLLKEEQSRLEEYLHLLEQSPKRSRATILAIATFLGEEYRSACKISQMSLSWPSDPNRSKSLQAFLARIKRWKAESERLINSLNNDGTGLLACRRDDLVGRNGRGKSSKANSIAGSVNEEYDSGDDILGIKSSQGSDSDTESDDSNPTRTIFKPPPGSKDPAVWEELNNMIGLEPVKRHLQEIIATVSVAGNKGMHSLHLMLSGNPGVGKTTVARLYGRILKDLKILPSDKFEEQKMSTLTGRYLGQTENNTKDAIERAQGGVLFIDEVHQLCSGASSNDYGKKVIDAIMPELENLRGSFVVIFATYASKVQAFFDVDPGLRRRVSEVIEFPDYSNEELAEILERMVAKDGNYQLEPELSMKVARMLGKMRGTQMFANAGSVRNAYEKAQRKVNARAFKRGNKDNTMKAKDFAFLEEWISEAKKGGEN